MRSIGLCTSSRSERHLMESLVNEMNSGKYKLKAELIDINSMFFTPLRNTSFDILREYDFMIIPADRTEMTRFAYECFIHNIPFCHFLCGTRSFSFTHDDVNRQMISLMANFCFAESPEAQKNLIEMGMPEDRIMVTGTSHFDGITMQDIEASKPKDTPEEPYDLFLMNPETQHDWHFTPLKNLINDNYVILQPNEDFGKLSYGRRYTHLEFLYLLYHADHFISNSSVGNYELPTLWLWGSKSSWVQIGQRNKERTPIPPEYCQGASKRIAEWSASVDLDWLKKPKRLFQKKEFPSGF